MNRQQPLPVQGLNISAVFLNFLPHQFTPCCQALCNTNAVLFKSGHLLGTFGAAVRSSVVSRSSRPPRLLSFPGRPRTFCLKSAFCSKPSLHVSHLNVTMWSSWTRWDGDVITWWRSDRERWDKVVRVWTPVGLHWELWKRSSGRSRTYL